MRVILLLLICVALATSGCFGKDDEPTNTTPTPTGGGTTTTPAPTGATPTSPTTGGNTTAPPVLQPRELCPVTNDFSSMTPTPPATTATRTGDCGTVPAGYTKMTLSGNFTAGTPPLSGPGIVVKVLDSTGAVAASCAGPGPGPVAAPTPCTGDGTVAAGAYTLQFEGTGGVAFSGSVQIRP